MRSATTAPGSSHRHCPLGFVRGGLVLCAGLVALVPGLVWAAPTVEQSSQNQMAPDEAVVAELLAAGKAVEAQSALQVASLARPDSPALQYQLAVAAALGGDRPVALAAALAAVRLDPGNAAAVSLAAALHLAVAPSNAATAPLAKDESMGVAAQALADGRLRAAATLAAEEADVLRAGAQARVRGLALLGLGRAEEALPALRAAAAAGPTDAAIWLALGVAYSGVGRAEAARICFDVARATAPPRSAVAAAAREALTGPRASSARTRP